MRRARAHGFSAFCLTVDSAYYSRPERDLAGRYTKPWRPADAAGMGYQAALSWRTVKRLKESCGLPLILKGIATAEDAEIAVAHGVDVIYVSNHGGRQLDHGLGSAAVLPQIVAAVNGRAEVWVDGGFMRGSDVVKAIALGARTVGIAASHASDSPPRARPDSCARWNCSKKNSASARGCSGSPSSPD